MKPQIDHQDAYALASILITMMIDAVRRDPDVDQQQYFEWCLLFAPLSERIAEVIETTVNRMSN